MKVTKFLIFKCFIIISILNCSYLTNPKINVTNLLCECKNNPLGIDNLNPRLSWQLVSNVRGQTQTAYQILVASDPEKLTEQSADLWNSGKIESNQTINIKYQGKTLQSGNRYFWSVQIWDKSGNLSNWSKPSFWEMGLFKKSDWQGDWFNDGKHTPEKVEDFFKENPSPLFRKIFKVKKKVKKARLYISGLGYYEARINGNKVGDIFLDPAWTNYSKRTFYSTFDVTKLLQTGENCFGIILGNGWYNPLPLLMWGGRNIREALPVGRPRFISQLNIEYSDGTKKSIVSNHTWKVTDGPIIKNNVYLGEVYDARKEISNWDQLGFDDSNWRDASVATEPIGKLEAQPFPQIRNTATLKPQKVTEPKPGIFIYDFGQNFAGLVKMRLKAPAGTQITLRYGELLYKDGTLNPMTSVCGQIKGKRKNKDGSEANIGGPGSPEIAWQSDVYISKGSGWEEYTPRFTFHSFRYVEVTGFPGKPPKDLLEGIRLNTDVKKVGSFSCSNEMFNKIQQMCEWTFLSNIFSVQSDCPHREKFGYGGDIVATSEAFMMNYDMANFYTKTVQDWQDAALEDGMLTDTAPFVGIQYCGIGWAIVHPLLQLQLYQYYGNRQIIEEQYLTSKKWFDLVIQQYPDYIVTDGLSDHESLNPTPAPLLVTPLFYQSAKMLSKLAAILSKNEDSIEYQELAKNIKKSYITNFIDLENGTVGPGTQTSQLFSLFQQIVPDYEKEAALKVLLKNITEKNEYHLTTGIIGTKFLFDVLSREHYADVAYKIANQKTFPGWGFMLENDATTLWEHWEFSDNTYSHNHPMFGSVSQWFYHWLGGIQPHPDAIGFDQIIIRPQFVENLEWVNCSYNSIRGKIINNWQQNETEIKLNIQIPVGAEAIVYLPSENEESLFESGQQISLASDIQFVEKKGSSFIYRINSGSYSFKIEK